MKKIISIIVAALIFLASLIANVYFVFDGDPETKPNFTEVVDKGKDVYDAVKSEDESNNQSEN